MQDMSQAVDRIQQAIAEHEQVVVYGDYDIDGITATAVLAEVLRLHGLVVRSYIPDRFEEGYGLNLEALERLQADGAQLVVSVDCGITSVAEADWARTHGLDLIITDHHAPPAVLPQAVAVINPKRADDDYPAKDLAGVGVVFTLARALSQRTGKPTAGQLKWLLDLVAFGTVCDVVSLTGENRVLVTFGLRVMAQTRRAGLKSLAAVAGIDLAKVGAHDLGYRLGPRLNAAGRLEHAHQSLELVETAATARATVLAGALDELNRQRRDDQQLIQEQAEVYIQADNSDGPIVLADERWSQGIVGIVASKLVDKYQRPALVAQVLGDITKGSGRSVTGYNLIEALRLNPELFLRFGGHAYAAGFTLPTARFRDLRDYLQRHWSQHPPTLQSAEASVDLEIEHLRQLDRELVEQLARLEPFGNGNPEPVLAVSAVPERVETMGSAGRHLRMELTDGGGVRLRAVAFGQAGLIEKFCQPKVRLTGYLQVNDYQGKKSLQFNVKAVIS
jgi:single-stranded-DNA-specific exonuclease